MILSADDFGISPAVDEGILMLIEKNIISSVSCMVTGTNPSLTKNLDQLKRYDKKIDVGLHLVLTDHEPLVAHSVSSGLIGKSGHFHSLKSLGLRAYSGQVSPDSLDLEIKNQVESFTSIFGRGPDFIDGHQHIQQYPVIRNSIMIAMKSFPSLKYIRIANLPNHWIWSSAKSVSPRFAIENLALAIPGRQAAAVFAKENIPHNRYLLGYYRHTPDVQFKTIFSKYLSIKPQSKDIFFCHPGFIDEHLKKVDSLVSSRLDNLKFLLSAEFEDLCFINKISINKFI